MTALQRFLESHCNLSCPHPSLRGPLPCSMRILDSNPKNAEAACQTQHRLPQPSSNTHDRQSPALPLGKRKRSITFSKTVSFHETFSRQEYNRSAHSKAELTFRDMLELESIKLSLERAAKLERTSSPLPQQQVSL
ncbi:hypothetical protein BCR33DRAFT_714398 [Rhizoclosmatium globosum]|uniref:Uncharacterized protein n=1 Tax=Rhizoclosmatium globosum TaxID=329046 RepID=A0A1Y2CNQ3_9FUNG|nr:hypothetical protein BCR33DRAFT_714398 [Rhizoclosmatium globosum]|eukprot:ORY48669.1 hypothetical protein BCR33DRAFT_714398 [Rhizoclosmatium globosum]